MRKGHGRTADTKDVLDLRDGVEHWRLRRNMTRTGLAKAAGVSPATVIKLLKGQRTSIRIHIVQALANALDVSIPALYARFEDEILDWVREDTDFVRDTMKSRKRLAVRDTGLREKIKPSKDTVSGK
jgi:transcriptional regulator with XRE-family HTH domain